jgi:hypothetical protein
MKTFLKRASLLQDFLIKNEDEDFCETQKLDNSILEEHKRLRIMDKRLNEIFKEMGIYLIFLFFLYHVSYTNLSSSAFTYNLLFQQTFVDSQSSNETGLNDVFIRKSFYIS